MKYLCLAILFCPIVLFAREKKPLPNVCDSLNKVVILDHPMSPIEIGDNIMKVLKAYTVHKEELISVERLNDSTLVGTGIFFIEQSLAIRVDDVFGKYQVPGNADGKISFRFVINTKVGKYRYDFYDLNHFHCRNEYGFLCKPMYDPSYLIVNGLKIQFYRRVADINTLITKALSTKEW